MKLLKLLPLLFVFFISCSTDDSESETIEELITASDINLTLEFNPQFDNYFFPSYWYGIANYSNKAGVEPPAAFKVNYMSPAKSGTIKIEFEETIINERTIIEKATTGVVEETTIIPEINWNYQSLKNISQPGSLSMTVNLYFNNELITTKYLGLNYRSINDCLFALKSEGSFESAHNLFAAYVNENHPKIDPILSEVLQLGSINEFIGDQQGGSRVYEQVESIWYWMQSKGIKYSSITATSSVSNKVASQYVRFFDEVIDNNQANCVDGSVFIASILRKIGINPLLIIVPGHMFLAFEVNNGQSIYALETTKVGNVDLRNINSLSDVTTYYNQGYLTGSEYTEYFLGLASLDKTKKRISSQSFYLALLEGAEKFNTHINLFDKQFDCKIIDIAQARTRINPIK